MIFTALLWEDTDTDITVIRSYISIDVILTGCFSPAFKENAKCFAC